MNTSQVILTLYKYYSRFVSKPVLAKTFVKPSKQAVGYDEVISEVSNYPDTNVIPAIDAFVFSANEAFVSEKVKNSKGIVLYVEYGAFSYSPNQAGGVKEKLAVHIACPYSPSNNDNLNETLLMDNMHGILCSILDQMELDQKQLLFCGTSKLVEFPAEIVAIDPPLFYDRIGWMAIFDYSTTNIL